MCFKIHGIHDDQEFRIVHFPFIIKNIPASFICGGFSALLIFVEHVVCYLHASSVIFYIYYLIKCQNTIMNKRKTF